MEAMVKIEDDLTTKKPILLTGFEEHIPDMIHLMSCRLHFKSENWTEEAKKHITEKCDKDYKEGLYSQGFDTDDDIEVTVHNGIAITPE